MNYIGFQLGSDKTIKWSKNDIEKAIRENDVNKKIDDETMLMHSVKVGDYDLSAKLIKLGADTSLGDKQNRTPLWLCTIYNNAKTAELLIEAGASMEEEPGHNSPLYNAIKHDNDEVAISLIKLGANPNLKNRDDQTPLHCAVFRSNYKIVKMLLEYGADKNIKNNIKLLPGEIPFNSSKNQSPYEMALEKGDKKLIALFEEPIKAEKKNKGNNEVSDKDLKIFYEYLINESNINEQREKTSEINDDFLIMNKKIENGQYYNIGVLLDDYEENEAVNLLVNKYYKDQLLVFENISDKIWSLEKELTNNNYKLGNDKEKLNSLTHESELLKEHKEPTISDILKENKHIFLFMYVPFVLYFLFFVFVYNGLTALGVICIILLFYSLFLIGEVSDEYDKKKSKAIYIIILVIHLFLPQILLFVLKFNIEKVIMGFCMLALIDFTIPSFLLINGKTQKAKKRYIEAQQDLKKVEKEKRTLSKKYNKANDELQNENKKIKEECLMLEKELIEIRKETINKFDLLIKSNELYKEVCYELIKEQQRAVTRWNEFAEFRKKHYVREIEDKIEDSGIIYDIAELTSDNEKLNKSKINSKNYDKTGEISDYIEYIYDCIDDEDEQL